MKIGAIIIGIILIGSLVFFMLPSSRDGEQLYSVEISASINQQKLIGLLPFVPAWTISNVNHKVVGETSNWEFFTQLGLISEPTEIEFCIDSLCQKNRETFLITDFFGEQEVSSEVISYVKKGTHTLTIKLFVDSELEASYSEGITV